MEIGSFIELAFPHGKEWYSNLEGTARLNTGRAAIYHASKVLGCNTVYLPLYQCKTVEDFLHYKGITVKKYLQDDVFTPLIGGIEENACIVIANYFGIMSDSRMRDLCLKYKNVIIDNSQAFFAKPIPHVMNVYSARKFIGVPDGAYLIGSGAEQGVDEYDQGYSSDTSLFLLQRIEYGCEGKTYQNKILNEERINAEDIKRMSKLTYTILDGTEYDVIIERRRENFRTASVLFKDCNLLNPLLYYDSSCVPMVYPLLLEDDEFLARLLSAKHFQGHWWNYLLKQTEENSFEFRLSKYMVPITIDQRYGEEELRYLRGLV